MSRLTEKNWRNLDPWECCGQDDYCKRGCHDEGGCNNGCIVPKIYDKLARYEEAEEQGRLIVLPCNVGDAVYSIKREKCRKIKECRDGDICSEMIANVCQDYFGKQIIYEKKFSVCDYKNIGKSVFLSLEEAEKALDNMKEE